MLIYEEVLRHKMEMDHYEFKDLLTRALKLGKTEDLPYTRAYLDEFT